jgi:TfoX/Sxy family transcriptional regulator of competence genes
LKKRARAMPRWRPAPAALVRQFEAAIAGVPGAELRKMFGYPAAFVRGHMFAGLFQEHMILRLAAEDRAELARRPGAQPFEPMPGRPMREYLVVPPAIRETPPELERWLGRASSYAGSLPPKRPRGKTPRRTQRKTPR